MPTVPKWTPNLTVNYKIACAQGTNGLTQDVRLTGLAVVFVTIRLITSKKKLAIKLAIKLKT